MSEAHLSHTFVLGVNVDLRRDDRRLAGASGPSGNLKTVGQAATIEGDAELGSRTIENMNFML